ncbi:MAG: transglutaminase domain-containing protein [Sphingomonadales bacterium]|nr:transglutaminase domain-containing protein [Sphingomonadales bacterium]
MPGQIFEDAYRTVSLDRLVDIVLLEGFAFADDMAAARREALEAVDHWIEGGLPTRQGPDGPLFDPVEVDFHATRAGRRGDDDFWERHFVATLRGFVTELEREAPQQMTVDYTRTFNLDDVPAGETKRLRMPLPLPGRYANTAITPHLPPDTVGHRLSDGRLEVRVVSQGAPIRIGARCIIELASGRDEELANRDLYLRPSEGLVATTPQVEALAHRLAGSEHPEAAIRNLFDHLLDDFTFCQIHYDQVPVETPLDWVLRTRVYDCQLASALFIAMCRARGIPARMVSGNFLYRRSPTNHYWAEAWLENGGWTPFDFIAWDLSCGGVDSDWRNRFFGQVDPRLVTECLPLSFTGATGVAVPSRWHILRSIAGTGAAIDLIGLDGRSVYRDEVSIV